MPKPNNTLLNSSTRTPDGEQTRAPSRKQNGYSGSMESSSLADVISRPDHWSAGDMPVLQRSVGNRTTGRLVAQRSTRPDRHIMDTPAEQVGISDDLMADIEAMIENKLGAGSPLDDQTRTRMEGTLMFDLSNVRIHTDQDSAWMAQTLSAQAFTVGSDIFFNAGMYNPGSTEGDRLVAHELAHVQQQGGGPVQAAGGGIDIDSISQPGDDNEVAAEQVAEQAAAGGAGTGNSAETEKDDSTPIADQAKEDAKEESSGSTGEAQGAEKKTEAAQKAAQAASAVKSIGASPDSAAGSAESVAAIVEAAVAPDSGISPAGAAGAVAGAALTKDTAGVAKEVTHSDSPGEMAGEVAASIAESTAIDAVQSAPLGGGGGDSSGAGDTEEDKPADQKQEDLTAGGQDAKQGGADDGDEKKEEAEDNAKEKEKGAKKEAEDVGGETPGGPAGAAVGLTSPDEFATSPEAEIAADPAAGEIPSILEDGPAALGDMPSMGSASTLGAAGGDSFAMPCTGLAGFSDLLPDMPEGLDYSLPPTPEEVSDPNAKVEADPTGKGVEAMAKSTTLSYSGPSQGLEALQDTVAVLEKILEIMDYITYAALGMLVLAGLGILIASLPFWQLAYKIPLLVSFITNLGVFMQFLGVIYFSVRGLAMILRSIMIAVMLTEGVHPDLIRAEAESLTMQSIGTLTDSIMAVGPAVYKAKAGGGAAAKAGSEGGEAAAKEGAEAAAEEGAEAAAREGAEAAAGEGAEAAAREGAEAAAGEGAEAAAREGAEAAAREGAEAAAGEGAEAAAREGAEAAAGEGAEAAAREGAEAAAEEGAEAAAEEAAEAAAEEAAEAAAEEGAEAAAEEGAEAAAEEGAEAAAEEGAEAAAEEGAEAAAEEGAEAAAEEGAEAAAEEGAEAAAEKKINALWASGIAAAKVTYKGTKGPITEAILGEKDTVKTDDRPVQYDGKTMTYSEAEAQYRAAVGNAEATLPPESFTLLSPTSLDEGLLGEASGLIAEKPDAESGAGDADPAELPITAGTLQVAAVDYQKKSVQNRITVLDDDIKRKQAWGAEMTAMEDSLTNAGGDLSATTAYLNQQVITANKAIASYDAVQNNLIASNALVAAALIILLVGAYITTDPFIIAMAYLASVMLAGILASSIASWVKIGERKKEAEAVIANNNALQTKITGQEGSVDQTATEVKTTRASNEQEIEEMTSRKAELEEMLSSLTALREQILEACPTAAGTEGGEDSE